MKPKVRMMVLLAVLPLFVGMMIGYTVNSSEAQMLKPTHPDVKQYQLSPKSYGSANSQVCGDRLCGETMDITPAFDIEEEDRVNFISQYDEDTPTTKLISIQKLRESTNKADAITHIITFSVTAGQTNLENIIITFSVTAGQTNLENIGLHVSSDIGSTDFNIESLVALKSSVNVIRIMALDADSIDGGITGYTLAPPTFDARNPNR